MKDACEMKAVRSPFEDSAFQDSIQGRGSIDHHPLATAPEHPKSSRLQGMSVTASAKEAASCLQCIQVPLPQQLSLSPSLYLSISLSLFLFISISPSISRYL